MLPNADGTAIDAIAFCDHMDQPLPPNRGRVEAVTFATVLNR